MLNKKYTMEQFEEMFDEAVVKTIDKLIKEFKENSKEEMRNPMLEFAFSMQNTMAMCELKKMLFKESGKNE